MMFKKAFAKLDLGISISPVKMKDGYFPVYYLDCQIDIYDKIFLTFQKTAIDLICNSAEIPMDEENFVYKAAKLFKEVIGNSELGAKIKLVKNIPIKAGFGGGSSDGAAALLALSKLWKVIPTEEQIKQLSFELGKDFYYSIFGKLSEVVGAGRNWQIKKFSATLPRFWLLVVVPKQEKPSTAWAYKHLDPRKIGKNSDKMNKLKRAILRRDRVRILENLTNDFEHSVSSHFPVVLKIKEDLKRVGANASVMAGAGLSVAGFFDSKKEAQAGEKRLMKMSYLKQIMVVKTI